MDPEMVLLHDGVHIKQEVNEMTIKEEHKSESSESDSEETTTNTEIDPSSYLSVVMGVKTELHTSMKIEESNCQLKHEDSIPEENATISKDDYILSGTSDMMDVTSPHSSHQNESDPLASQSDEERDQIDKTRRNNKIKTLNGHWKNLSHLKSKKTHTGQAAQKYQHRQWAKHKELLKPHLSLAHPNCNLQKDDLLEEKTAQEHKPHLEEQNLPDIPHTSVSNQSSVSCNATIPPNTKTEGTTARSKKTKKRKRQNTTQQEGLSVEKKSQSPTISNKVVSYYQNRPEMDAVDHLFHSWAKTVKTFSPQRLMETKIKMFNFIRQQENKQLEENMINRQRLYTSILSKDTSTASRSTPVAPQNISQMSPNCDTCIPQENPVEIIKQKIIAES